MGPVMKQNVGKKPATRGSKTERELKVLSYGTIGSVAVTPASIRRKRLMNETARLSKLSMDSEFVRNIAVTRSGRISKPLLRGHIGEYIRYDIHGRALEVKSRRTTGDLYGLGGASAGAEILASLLQCGMKVDVAVSSSKDKRIFDDSSLSEVVFKQTKKHEKNIGKKSPPLIQKTLGSSSAKQKHLCPSRPKKEPADSLHERKQPSLVKLKKNVKDSENQRKISSSISAPKNAKTQVRQQIPSKEEEKTREKISSTNRKLSARNLLNSSTDEASPIMGEDINEEAQNRRETDVLQIAPVPSQVATISSFGLKPKVKLEGSSVCRDFAGEKSKLKGKLNAGPRHPSPVKSRIISADEMNDDFEDDILSSASSSSQEHEANHFPQKEEKILSTKLPELPAKKQPAKRPAPAKKTSAKVSEKSTKAPPETKKISPKTAKAPSKRPTPEKSTKALSKDQSEKGKSKQSSITTKATV